jgi:CheY-like chemotaxis protein
MEPKASILLVEDSRFVRTAAASMLRNQGFRVWEAVSGDEAVRMTRELLPDLILLDMVIPGLQGHEVLYVLKHDFRTEHIPVIVLSGAQPGANDALRGGAAAFLAKENIGITEMMDLVELVLRGRRRAPLAMLA